MSALSCLNRQPSYQEFRKSDLDACLISSWITLRCAWFGSTKQNPWGRVEEAGDVRWWGASSCSSFNRVTPCHATTLLAKAMFLKVSDRRIAEESVGSLRRPLGRNRGPKFPKMRRSLVRWVLESIALQADPLAHHWRP